jgi:rhodanese-related sulfurtransferase
MMKFEAISSKDLDRYINDRSAVIIDIRPKEEYEQSHLRGAVNVPYEILQKSCVMWKDKCLILYCERGSTSLMAARELSKQGYRVKTVIGGIHVYPGNNIEYKNI